MTSKAKQWALTAVFVLIAPLLHAANSDLDKVLQQMNAASAKFQNAQADIEMQQFQAVVRETDTQKGTIAFQRTGKQTLVALHIQQEDGKPVPKDFVFRDNKLKLYEPLAKRLTIFSAGPDQSQMIESYFTLGFGASGDDLQKNWDITYQGIEPLDNVQTVKLDLKPKQDSVKKTVTHVTIWMDPTRSIALKQLVVQSSGDSRTVIFTNIRYNQSVKKDVFEIKTASGTEKITK